MQSEFEELAAKSLKDRQALLAAQSELEAANASKVRESGAATAGLNVLTDGVLECPGPPYTQELNLREQEKLRKRLSELQTEHDAQEQAFAALRRDKAVLDLQLGQLEKRVRSVALSVSIVAHVSCARSRAFRAPFDFARGGYERRRSRMRSATRRWRRASTS